MSDLAQQEGVLRLVNEAIKKGFWPGEDDVVATVRCECGRPECHEYLRIRTDRYESLRAHPRWFVVRGQHQLPQERVVARGDGYLVVEKVGEHGAVAEASDPRSDADDRGSAAR